jgi:hypothetical protein
MSAQVLSGTLSGRLEGTFVLGDTSDGISGRTELDISGSGEYVCFSPLPGPYEPCMVEQGQLLPIRLDVVDSGNFTLTADGSGSNGRRADVTGKLVVEAQVNVDLDRLVRNDPTAIAATGTLTVIDAAARFQDNQ